MNVRRLLCLVAVAGLALFAAAGIGSAAPTKHHVASITVAPASSAASAFA